MFTTSEWYSHSFIADDDVPRCLLLGSPRRAPGTSSHWVSWCRRDIGDGWWRRVALGARKQPDFFLHGEGDFWEIIRKLLKGQPDWDFLKIHYHYKRLVHYLPTYLVQSLCEILIFYILSIYIYIYIHISVYEYFKLLPLLVIEFQTDGHHLAIHFSCPDLAWC